MLDINRFFDQFVYHSRSPIIFNSGMFLFLFLGFLTFYFLLHKTHRAKLTFVTLFSLYFYYKSSGIYFFILIGSTVVDYTLANFIYSAKNKLTKKALLIFSLIVNLGLLGYFKYTNFLFSIFSDVSGQQFQHFDIFLPVGVSFFTFQSLSYTIDIYRGTLKPVDNIFDYAFFVSFFPQLVAGPIVRAADFLPQINKPTFVSREMFGQAVFLIVSGLFKKAIISDYISLNFVDRIFDNPTLYTGLENLFGVYGYALQIYCDFSGYSDMAIGIALLLGFRFCKNFDSPYQSKNITEFWRRWHMSLSSWLRDYLYISLGGSRKGKIRTYVNLMLTMLLGGLWHGAAFKFIIWGALHGVGLALHKIYMNVFKQTKQTKSVVGRKIINVFSVLFTFHFVCAGWIFFRATNMKNVKDMFIQIFYNFNPQIFFNFISGYDKVLWLMLMGFVLHFIPSSVEQKAENIVVKLPLFGKAMLLLSVILLVMQVKSAEIQPFIYFQF